MALDDREWLPRAEALSFGSRQKVMHCGRDPSLSLTHDVDGYKAYCFRCGEGGFKPHGILSIRDIAERKRILAEVQDPVIKLPKDFTLDIPEQEALWLLRGGVPLRVARAYGFGYSAHWKRVILPVYKEASLVGFTSRSTIGERPKYVARLPTGQTFFRSDERQRLPSAIEDNRYVIVEDILSCVRVGRLQRSIALLGTSSSTDAVEALYHELTISGSQEAVVLWLDGDKAGTGAASRLARALRVRGVDVRNVSTTRDPKTYSNREIKELLA